MSNALNVSPVRTAPQTSYSHSAVPQTIFPWAHSMIAGSGVGFLPSSERMHEIPYRDETSGLHPPLRRHRAHQ